MKKNTRILPFVGLHGVMLIYSLCTVLAKAAAGEELFSLGFFLFYGLEFVVLAIYAVLWQQILKRMSLTTAFCNKAVTILWGMVWGALLFRETISPVMIVGASVVIVGVILVVSDNE